MPLVRPSSYEAPPFFRNGHVATIWPSLFRRVADVAYERERIETPDGDFLDLDWLRDGALGADGSRSVVVVSHGLEGSADRSYVRGMARAFQRRGWDAVAWNFRGCSGEPNRLLRFYHSGATDDLDLVLRHVLAEGYERAALVGFSLGGNLTLKYLGERGADVDAAVAGAVAFSTPCDLAAGAEQLARRGNGVYMRYFLKKLRQKVRAKMEHHPGEIDDAAFGRIRDFQAFDDLYTAPLHGFDSAEDYWRRCSCRQFLPGIRVPALLVNAWDDPFLPPACYPVREAAGHAHLFLETPTHGGHVGFPSDGDEYWSEARAARFVEAGGV